MTKQQEKVRFQNLSNYTEKQKEASKAVDEYKFVLYGGAMGGGKSYFLRWKLLEILLRFAQEGHRNVTVGLFCEDYPALKDRHLSKIRFEFPEWIGELKTSDNNFVLAPEYGGGVIAFRNLDDSSKYQSAEFAAIGIDEITKNKREVFDFLRTRLRWPGIKNVRFIGATNPGGIGHDWVKKLWLDHIYDEHESERDQFVYIPAKAIDNPHIDKTYLAGLQGLPEGMRRAFLEGDWDVFQGQYFKEWRRDLHVIKPFQIPPYVTSFICGDYGYQKPSAVYWCYKNSEDQVFVYRELYREGLTYENLMKEIISMTSPTEKIEYMVFDPAIWAKKDTEISGAEIMQSTYYKIKNTGINLIKGNNDRVIGWNTLREHLKPINDGKNSTTAGLQVFETCENLIRTLPSLLYYSFSKQSRDQSSEDLDTGGEDHAADAIRYGLMSRPRKNQGSTKTFDLIERMSKPKITRVISFE